MNTQQDQFPAGARFRALSEPTNSAPRAFRPPTAGDELVVTSPGVDEEGDVEFRGPNGICWACPSSVERIPDPDEARFVSAVSTTTVTVTIGQYTVGMPVAEAAALFYALRDALGGQ